MALLEIESVPPFAIDVGQVAPTVQCLLQKRKKVIKLVPGKPKLEARTRQRKKRLRKKVKKKKKKVAGVARPGRDGIGNRGRAQAEKVKSQLGIRRSKHTPIDPDRNPQAFDPGPIDERFIPKKSDLAQPVPGEESGGPRIKRDKNFGSSTGVFGAGAIDPDPEND